MRPVDTSHASPRSAWVETVSSGGTESPRRRHPGPAVAGPRHRSASPVRGARAEDAWLSLGGSHADARSRGALHWCSAASRGARGGRGERGEGPRHWLCRSPRSPRSPRETPVSTTRPFSAAPRETAEHGDSARASLVSRERPHAVDQPVDLVVGRVAGARRRARARRATGRAARRPCSRRSRRARRTRRASRERRVRRPRSTCRRSVKRHRRRARGAGRRAVQRARRRSPTRPSHRRRTSALALAVQRARTRAPGARDAARRRASPPNDARKSTAAAAPTIPSWFCVPVSSRSGAVSGAGASLGTSSASRAARRARRARRRAGRRTCTPSSARKSQPIAPHVDELVRREVHRVHERQRARRARHLRPRARRR